MMGPRFPVYIPSKGRAKLATTPKVLDTLDVPYRLIVEASQWDAYAEVYGAGRLLLLPPAYQAEYETFDDKGDQLGKGAGAARNFAWDHSMTEGHPWHWVVDDNIQCFGRLHRNERLLVGDGMIFAAMEDFTTRYKNVGMAGPEYWMFAPNRQRQPHPFVVNRRIFSCNLIRNDTGLRWRGRYNEDLHLTIDMLQAAWCTILFRTFLQFKTPTQYMPGGNTEELYQVNTPGVWNPDGTREKSFMSARQYPGIVTPVLRYGRWHHQADFSRFANLRLLRRDDYTPEPVNPYKTRVVPRPPGHGQASLKERLPRRSELKERRSS